MGDPDQPVGRVAGESERAAEDERKPGRPLIERIGLLGISAVFAAMFAAMALAAWVGGEVFLAALAALGAFMTVWAGLVTLLRS